MSTTEDVIVNPDLDEAVEGIKKARENFYTQSRRLKLDYLTTVADARTAFGTSAVADALDVSRHRIYQIERERGELERELDGGDA